MELCTTYHKQLKRCLALRKNILKNKAFTSIANIYFNYKLQDVANQTESNWSGVLRQSVLFDFHYYKQLCPVYVFFTWSIFFVAVDGFLVYNLWTYIIFYPKHFVKWNLICLFHNCKRFIQHINFSYRFKILIGVLLLLFFALILSKYNQQQKSQETDHSTRLHEYYKNCK